MEKEFDRKMCANDRQDAYRLGLVIENNGEHIHMY